MGSTVHIHNQHTNSSHSCQHVSHNCYASFIFTFRYTCISGTLWPLWCTVKPAKPKKSVHLSLNQAYGLALILSMYLFVLQHTWLLSLNIHFWNWYNWNNLFPQSSCQNHIIVTLYLCSLLQAFKCIKKMFNIWHYETRWILLEPLCDTCVGMLRPQMLFDSCYMYCVLIFRRVITLV